MKERAIITPGLIRQVQLMLAGGATGKEVAEITGTSEGTISRIKRAGFDYEQFQKNTEARRKTAEEPQWNTLRFPMKVEKVEETEDGLKITARQPEQLELQGGVDYQVKVNEELPGQIGMDLQPEKPAEMSDQVKMMRFLAGRFDLIEKSQALGVAMINENLVKINENLVKINENMVKATMSIDRKLSSIWDFLGQILRVIGPEGGKRG